MPSDVADRKPLVQLNGSYVAVAHTVFALSAFVVALVTGMLLHFHKIVQNEHFGYPDEWFPSVSATIGDRYPERSFFQILIAVTSGPRFALIGLWYLLSCSPTSRWALFTTVCGILRTFCCGGWVYITSTDDHDAHDIFMIAYLLLTIPWIIGTIYLTPYNRSALLIRKRTAFVYFSSVPLLIYLFIQHKVKHIPGAYTFYAFVEWSLVFYDVIFDAATIFDFSAFQISITDTSGISKFSHPEPLRPSNPLSRLNFCVHVINSYVLCTAVSALPLLIWYFPLWDMGVSGFEISALAFVSPALLLNTKIRFAVFKNIGTVQFLAALFGSTAWLINPPELRLFADGLATAFALLSFVAGIAGSKAVPGLADMKSVAYLVGFLLTLAGKVVYRTKNPAWPVVRLESGGLHIPYMILAIGASFWTYREQASASQPGFAAPANRKAELFVGLGLGGILFAHYYFFGDASTMINWIWDGYPLHGPTPVPYGFFIVLAAASGTLFGSIDACKPMATNYLIYAFSLFNVYLILCRTGWRGFIGSLNLATYLFALFPPYLQAASTLRVGHVFGYASLQFLLLTLEHVWVVAYAFVPLGSLLRERTWVIVVQLFASIGIGLYYVQKIQSRDSQKTQKDSTSALEKSLDKVYMYARNGFILVLFITGAGILYRSPTSIPEPYHPEERLFTAGIWTVHFGIDNDLWDSTGEMAKVLKELELDVVGLLETDTERFLLGNRDIGQELAEELNMYYDYGPGPAAHTWGCLLLSKFPILKSSHHLTPSPVGELAPAIHATLDMYGHEVDIVVFHSGQEEDVEDRRLQTQAVSTIMAESPNPLVLLSYLVTDPHKGNYNTYVSEYTRMLDIDPTDDDRWCEYILYRGLKRTGYARVSRGTITDTEIQVGKFIVGEEPNKSNRRIRERKVPQARRFPSMFKGKGVREHFYHVFPNPRYYDLGYPTTCAPGSNTGYPGSLTGEQKQKLEQLRSDLKTLGYEENLDDATLLRFLRARKFDVTKAKDMFIACEKWRKDFGVKDIVQNFHYVEKLAVSEYYPQYYHKTDKDGRPVYIEQLGKVNITEMYKITSMERMLKNLVWEYESLANHRLPACSRKAGHLIETSCTIMDLKGVGLGQISQVYHYVRETSVIGQNYYPERMGKFYMINAPFGFATAFKIIRPLLDPVTVEKIFILSSNYKSELLKQIPAENLPDFLGGNCRCPEGCQFSDAGPWHDPQYIGKEGEAISAAEYAKQYLAKQNSQQSKS
ncbi:hypothetical protein CANCADRAFT_2014 [Tortispora caseinolytica NRRL Y-17796]|uniref:CRAL-TRIO domain-containing protein n=1 Tax=Tortispora caseinolytica NRRL Y-17796 TaxID=767744 RepID=A0A1E4TET1_9ASCO|nr:hypothetical protein CANCADRAFT_2014 [Tortispora caseinolytica NRRL Y-17796]